MIGTIKLMCLALTAVVLAGCAGTTSRTEGGRVVMTEHGGWAIRITPSSIDNRWRARVEVWPPDRSPATHGGINVRFIDSAPDEKAIVQSATAAARSYIDASRTQHQ